MTTDDLLTRAERAADQYARHGTPAWGCFVDGFLAHAAQQPTRNDLIGWDDRKELADVFQDAGARFPIEGLSDDLYSGLLAVARWGAEQANGAGS